MRCARGYDAGHVRKAAIFPKDGNFPPYLDEELEKLIKAKGGQVSDNVQLTRILVRPDGEDDVRVSRIVCRDARTGEEFTRAVNSLYLSLGPSMKSMVVDPAAATGTSRNLMQKMMWASASSMVFMVRVDLDKVGERGMRCFRDYIDGTATTSTSSGWPRRTCVSVTRGTSTSPCRPRAGGTFPASTSIPRRP